MNTTNSIKNARLPATILIVLFSLIGWQQSSAKETPSTIEPGTIIAIESVLQELVEERCEIEADHRLTQDNPEKQTKDDLTYLCIHRWQVRLQSKK